jgi:hypothetical protein
MTNVELVGMPAVERLVPKPTTEALVIPDEYRPEVLPSTGEELEIIVDTDHAYEVLSRLLQAYQDNAPPYDQDRVRLPHDPRHMPTTMPYGGVEHAMFLFNVCYYMRGGIKSNDAVKRMAGLYDEAPELFDAEHASVQEPAMIEEILSHHGLGFQKTVSKQWVENSKRLSEKYDGDPRKIFTDVTNYEQSLDVIKNQKGNGFIGFQEKMTSMIIYYLMDEGLIEPFNFPIPIDLHVMRISIANKFISFPDVPYGTNLFTKHTLKALRDLYFNYAADNDVNPLRLCDAVWMLSESSCGKNPGNTTIEPLGRNHRNGRSTYLLPQEVDIHNPTQAAAYQASCGICPIESTCELNIPGTQYYVGGNIIIRGRRVRFPLPLRHPLLFDD